MYDNVNPIYIYIWSISLLVWYIGYYRIICSIIYIYSRIDIIYSMIYSIIYSGENDVNMGF
jgi:hypothetical protein